MTIGEKMYEGTSVPPEVQVRLLREKVADLLFWYKELQSLYRDATGIHWVPSELLPKAEMTADDLSFLKQLGIAPSSDQ